jgi:cyclohexanone monooxygenase
MMETQLKQQQENTEVIRLDALVVGCGISGIYMLHRLSQLGLSFRGIEAGSDVGGTWYWNRYPGARCDVPSLQYSYSFSEELQQSWRWPDKYSIQPAIHEYLQHVADRTGVKKHIDFHTRVVSQVYDEDEKRWTVRTDTGKVFSVRFCIMATGNLSLPQVPKFPGLESFRGRWYHSGLWPREGVDFSGQRVGLIGTGATGVQMVPKIAAQAKHLYVFQRTANFSVPARNGPLTDEEDRNHKAEYPKHRATMRQMGFGMIGFPPPTKSALELSAEERERIYEERWQQGGSINFLSAFNDLLTNEAANETASEFVRKKIRSIVKDPATAELLCPKDHPIGSKRLCVDTDYYETFNRPNVTLVDVRSDPIERVTEHGLKTRDASYELDSLAFATGFDAMTGPMLAIDIRGRGGRALKEKWTDGPQLYLGLMTAGFPNLFVITGPGSPSVKSNMTLSIEHHVDWIADCVKFMTQQGVKEIDAQPAAEREWVRHVNEVADATLYVKANSWYMGSNIPGKPRVFMPYVGGIPAYHKKCREVVESGYQGFVLA